MRSMVKGEVKYDLFLISGTDVGEHPRSFVLQLGTRIVGEELREAGHDSRLNHKIDRRVLV